MVFGPGPLLDLGAQFLAHEVVEERSGRLAAGDRLLGGRTEELSGPGKGKRAQDLLEGERGEVSRDRVRGLRGCR
jgi:hypothetical protein